MKTSETTSKPLAEEPKKKGPYIVGQYQKVKKSYTVKASKNGKLITLEIRN